MIQKRVFFRLSVAAALLGANAVLGVAQAWDFGNMMNPSRWFNNNDRYHDDYYYRDRYYGGYGPYGWGGPYGGPYGGWGGPWGGYPGYGGYGYGAPSTIVVNPSQGSSRSDAPPAPRVPE